MSASKPESRQMMCSECDEPMTDYQVRDGKGPVAERIVYTCPNGHRGYENYNQDGVLSQKAGFYWRDVSAGDLA